MLSVAILIVAMLIQRAAALFQSAATPMSVSVHVGVQVQLHVGMGTDPGGIRSFCEERGIMLQAETRQL